MRAFATTTHAKLAYEVYGEGATDILLIHGNSSCRQVFGKQLITALSSWCRVVTFDLPGHGESMDAVDPYVTYTLPGLAEATLQLIRILDLRKPIIFGWSLGGHIAIELLARGIPIRSLLLSGSPPISKLDGVNHMAEGFSASPSGGLVGKEAWTRGDAEAFVDRIFAGTQTNELLAAALRTDGRFRGRLFTASREGLGANQRNAVEEATIPIGIVNGAKDTIVKLDYFDSLRLQKPWRNTVHRVPGVGHAPFWQDATSFNELFQDFLLETRG